MYIIVTTHPFHKTEHYQLQTRLTEYQWIRVAGIRELENAGLFDVETGAAIEKANSK